MSARKAVLYLVDVSSGKLYPIKVTVLPDGTALLPISLEKDAVGLATEATLSAIKSQTDQLTFDEYGRLYIHDPLNLDVPLSTVRDNMNIARIGGTPQTGDDWTPYIQNIANLATEATLQALSGKLPSTLTDLGNLRVAIYERYSGSITLAASATRTGSGNTDDIDVGRLMKGEICIDVTDVSGTSPTLDVYVEGKDRVSGKYKTLFSQTGINSTNTFWTPNPIDIAFKYLRVRWVIGGTNPSFTFSVSLEGKS
jgi:hypothetical protein